MFCFFIGQAAYLARKADVTVAEANIKAAQSAISAVEANVARPVEIRSSRRSARLTPE